MDPAPHPYAPESLLVDESGTILSAGDEACRLLRYTAGELSGQTLEVLIPARFRLAHIGHRLRFTDDRRTRPKTQGREFFALCKDGSERAVRVSLTPVQAGLRTLMVAELQALGVIDSITHQSMTAAG